MNKNTLLNATITKLRAEALEAFAAIELLLENPESYPSPESIIEELARQSEILARKEGALLTFQQYFVPQEPKRPPTMPPTPPSPPNPPVMVDGDRSPTMRRAMESEDIKNRARVEKERLEATVVEVEEE